MSRRSTHSISKPNCDSITLLAGLGVDGDVHAGTTVKRRSRDQSLPNLRQVQVRRGDAIEIELPKGELRPLEPV